MSTQFLVFDKTLKVKVATVDNYNGEGIIKLLAEPLPSDPTQTPIMKEYSVIRYGYNGSTYLIATRDGVVADRPEDYIVSHGIEPYLE